MKITPSSGQTGRGPADWLVGEIQQVGIPGDQHRQPVAATYVVFGHLVVGPLDRLDRLEDHRQSIRANPAQPGAA